MNFERSSGILLHPTSLPSKFGIGDFGSKAYEFVDFLIMAKQKLWQILPLNPTGFADSPYQCFSVFAGNHLLISPEKMADIGLLDECYLENVPVFNEDAVEYEKVIKYKLDIYKKAYLNFKKSEDEILQTKYENFCLKNIKWLEDYSTFMALKEYYNGLPWSMWDDAIAKREDKAISEFKQANMDKIEFHKFLQFMFSMQWLELKSYANRNDIKIIGDIPIFTAFDSADVWASKENFLLDSDGKPISVAGVPPDNFSVTGQLWGNPIYNWSNLKNTGYGWWIERFRKTLELCDIIRLDHFRGFAAYWSIPFGEKTAINGEWINAPGAELFSAVENAMGKLPIIAEDLGVITPDVVELKNKFGFPGMNILQFAFNGWNPEYLPHNNEKNSVIYTGTHDNDTSLALFEGLTEKQKTIAKQYMNTANDGPEICWDFIRSAFSSPAVFAIIPMQDILCLGTEARMNFPGTTGGNWGWRYREDMVNNHLADKIAALASIYYR